MSYVLRCSYVECIDIYHVMSSSWIDPLIIMQCPSLSLIIFISRSILSDMRIATPPFFCFPFAWNIFFHPLTFSLYMSLGLMRVYCRQHIYRSWFCIHSASLLVGAFNPFTFKVIIDIYVPIAIFLIVWGWFCRSFFFSCISWLYKPLNICCKARLVVLNSINFCLSEKFLLCIYFSMNFEWDPCQLQ